MDYNSSCRLCLSKGGRQFPIFQSMDHNDLEPLSDRILSCLSISVSEFDGLPKQVCHRCECQVNVLHYFKAQCELSQRTLLRWQETLARVHQASSDFKVEETSQIDGGDIKQEPEDIERQVKHLINNCEDAAGSQLRDHDQPSEDADSINDFPHSEDDNLYYPYIQRQDTRSSCTLLISDTRCVAVEGAAHDTSLVWGEDKESNVYVNTTATSAERKNGTDMTFKQLGVIRHSSSVGNEPVQSAPHSLDAPDKLCKIVISDFIHLDDSENSLGSEDGAMIEDPLAESKDVRTQCFEKIMKVNQEGVGSELDNIPQPPPSSIVDVAQDSPPSLLASTVSQMEIPNEKGSEQNATKYVSYQHIDLPKINNHILDEKSKFCKICQKSVSNLWRHMKDRHAKENPFQCMGCDKVFSGRRDLVVHMIRTLNKCCRAGKKPVQDPSFVSINKSVPYGVKGRYQCNTCKLKFTKLSYVVIHARLHTGERPFFCFKCNRDFRLKKTAANHILSCTGKDCFHPALASDAVKPVSSTIKISQILKGKSVKVKPVPSKDKLTKCPVCSKTFNSSVGLSNHLRGGCARKCFSCLELVSEIPFSKHHEQCLKKRVLASEKQTLSNHSDRAEDDKKDTRKDVKDTGKDVKKKETGPITEIVDASVQELMAKHTDSLGNRLLTCQLCQRTMANPNTLYRHLIMHSSISVLKCKLCNVRMSMPSVYKAHMLKFHSGSQVEGNCKPDARPSVSIENNIKSSRAKVKFSCFKLSKMKCDVCLKQFNSATSLKFHKQTHKKVKCGKCEITFPASMEKSHACNPKIRTEQHPSSQGNASYQGASILSLEKIPIQYTCHMCKKKFHTRKMLYQHKKMHIKVKIYKCKVCGNSYSDAVALLEHKLAVHANKELLPACANDEVQSSLESSDPIPVSSCDGHRSDNTEEEPWKRAGLSMKSCKTPKKLHGPMNSNANKIKRIEGLYKCSMCDKAFSSEVSFVAHKGWHSRQMIVESPLCGEETETPESQGLTAKSSCNSLKSPKSSQETYACNLCPREFLSMKSLRIHVTVNHTKPKRVNVKEKIDNAVVSESNPKLTFQCDSCPSAFADLSSSSTHMNSHSKNSTGSSNSAVVPPELPKQETLLCKLCNKEYRCKKSLKYHMMGHLGEKPYKCRSCSNQYSNPKALSKHERERHTVVLRPFCCNRCKASFILKEDLLAHHEKCSHK